MRSARPTQAVLAIQLVGAVAINHQLALLAARQIEVVHQGRRAVENTPVEIRLAPGWFAASAVPPSIATSLARRRNRASGQLGEDGDRALGRIGNRCLIAEIGPPVVLQQLSESWQRLASLQPFEGAYRQHPSRGSSRSVCATSGAIPRRSPISASDHGTM